jgi:hypothetical protein
MAMPWWFVVFCLLPVQIAALAYTARVQRKTWRTLATLRQEAVALTEQAALVNDRLAAMERFTVLLLALWRISWRQR